MLLTNVTDFSAEQIVSRYKSLREVTRIGVVIAVLKSFVLRNRSGVDQLRAVAVVGQPIDQPVAVAGGFDRYRSELLAEGCQSSEHRVKVVGKSAFELDAVCVVDDRKNAIVGMQIDGCVK
ncbi:MAG: hypothetical protein CVV15_07200 [Gammaproteobacteria bacterium HGW-Gammaproteobacteria-5]|nr:MAG: hypothetical protein CVV15_07200 [Gammaproteobacteria bacterium HGW-Gammaproteobacteria-5]